MEPDAVAATQRRQHGLITLDQAVSAGLTAEQVRDRHRRGLWTVERRGVYAPSGAPPTAHRAILGAVLAADGPVWASHGTAGWLWQLRGVEQPDDIELLRPLGRHVRLEGIIGHRSGAVFSADLTTRLGIPTTTVERTVVELSGRFSSAQLGRIVDDALRRRMLHLDRLRRCTGRLDTAPGRRLSVVRAVLAERLPGYHPGDSDLETYVLRTIVGAGLPPPVQQCRVRVKGRTFKLDLALPEHKAGFELDSWHIHGTRSAFDDDRVRDNLLRIAGWQIYHFTDRTGASEIIDTVSSVLQVFARPAVA